MLGLCQMPLERQRLQSRLGEVLAPVCLSLCVHSSCLTCLRPGFPVLLPLHVQLFNYVAFSQTVDPHLGAFEEMVQ